MILKRLRSVYGLYLKGKAQANDNVFVEIQRLSNMEIGKRPRRTDIINHFITRTEGLNYLEIGVRDPSKNFNKIAAAHKFSVDPGVEFLANPATYKLTSDSFFGQLKEGEFPELSGKEFDVIFIDGLHLAEQVDKDIKNALEFLKPNGFIILHDCNPPSEYHQREDYNFKLSPATSYWNGTTWKAFYKYRHSPSLFSACFDTDWGVGVISKQELFGFNRLSNTIENEYYDFESLSVNRKLHLNLLNFQKWLKESQIA